MKEHQMETVRRKPVRLIAAACRGLGIGKDGALPWNLPTEFQFFMDSVTRVSKPAVIWSMSLPRTPPEHAHFLSKDFDSAVVLASQPPLSDIVETIWVVGGTQVYKDGMMHPWCDLIYLTDVMATFECDVFFPEFDRNLFQLQDKFPGVPSEIQKENGIAFKFQVFKKKDGQVENQYIQYM